MNEHALAALLLEMTRDITHAQREAIEELRTDVTTQIGEVRSTQASQGREIGELRTVIEERTKPGAVFRLSRGQKAALVSAGLAVLSAVGEGLRHLIVWAVAWVKSGAPGVPTR